MNWLNADGGEKRSSDARDAAPASRGGRRESRFDRDHNENRPPGKVVLDFSFSFPTQRPTPHGAINAPPGAMKQPVAPGFPRGALTIQILWFLLKHGICLVCLGEGQELASIGRFKVILT